MRWTTKHPGRREGLRGAGLGSTRDLSALVIAYQDLDGVFHTKPYCWIPGDVRERTADEPTPYDLWVKEGFLLRSANQPTRV